MASTAGIQAPFTVGDRPTDFKMEGINTGFIVRDFKGFKRANESFLSTIEKATGCLLWQRSLIEATSPCKPVVTKGTFRIDDGKTSWSGTISVMKEGKNVGNGEFFATFETPLESKTAIMNDVYVKMYKDQRDRVREACST